MSSWTDEPKRREEPAMFSEEVARGEKDLETELRERDGESRPYQYCPFCWKPVDRRLADTFFEATVWLRGLHKDSATLREYSGQAAHADCIKRVSDQRKAAAVSSSDCDSPVVAVRDAEVPGQLELLSVERTDAGVVVFANVTGRQSDDLFGDRPFNGSIGFTVPSTGSDGVLT